MRVKPMTPEQRERHLEYQREYSRVRRAAKSQSVAEKKLEARRRIAAAILIAEMNQENDNLNRAI